MKIIKLLLPLLLIYTALSCTDDDKKQSISGVYSLIAVNAPRGTDFNRDGTASVNLMEESGCYKNSYIDLKEDGTFTSKYNYVFFFSSTGCYTEEVAGIWQEKNNTITLTNPTANTEAAAPMQYVLRDNKLVITQESSYPGYDDMGEPIFIEGMVETVYEKQAQ